MNGSDSPLELNIQRSITLTIREKIEGKYFEIDLFSGLEKELMHNIADTWSRFILTNEYRVAVAQQQLIQEFGKAKRKTII